MTLTNPTVLAFERKLCCSDALMYSGSWTNKNDKNNWLPVVLQHKDVRGTISNRLSKKDANDPMKLDAKIDKPNLQSIDVASLPFDSNTLKVEFTMKFLGDFSTPNVCNDQDYQKALESKMTAYVEQEQFKELSLRYAENLANGRFLWRNRIGAEEIEIHVSQVVNGVDTKTWIFNGFDFNLREFTGSQNAKLQQLAEIIRSGLMGSDYVMLKVEAYARIGGGQEVYPSQEFMREDSRQQYKKSRVLYHVQGNAAMHSQKIGNALRTIDTWYPLVEEYGPIAVECYGSVTSRGIACRRPKDKMDFYNLFDNWILKDQTPPVEQQHYVVACLIRGGVFGEAKKDD